MAIDTETATDGFFTMFKTVWDDPVLGWQAIPDLTEEPYVRWPNLEEGNAKDPDTDKPWIWIGVQHDESENESFGDGAPNYLSTGIVLMQIFTPLGCGLTLDRRLVKVAKRAFQGKRGPGIYCDIIFRGVRVREIGSGDRWHQSNAIASFEYDEEN